MTDGNCAAGKNVHEPAEADSIFKYELTVREKIKINGNRKKNYVTTYQLSFIVCEGFLLMAEFITQIFNLYLELALAHRHQIRLAFILLLTL